MLLTVKEIIVHCEKRIAELNQNLLKTEGERNKDHIKGMIAHHDYVLRKYKELEANQ